MEPRIQYAKTKDGVSIAFWTLGKGMPFLHLGWPLSHAQLLWESPVTRPWLEALAQRYQLVFYDSRGNGLSQRGLASLTLDMVVLDMEAVVERLSLDRFVVFAPFHQGQAAVQYTIENTGRVAALILWGSYVGGDALEQTRALTLAEKDWELFLQSVAQLFNWLEPRDVRDYVDLLRQGMTREDYLTTARAAVTFDIEPLLPQVGVPTLVLHPRELAFLNVRQAVRLASLVPDARLVLLQSPIAIPIGDNLEPTLEAIEEFVEEVSGGGVSQKELAGSGAVHTILFTDVEGSTALTQRLGDAKARELLREHERMVREALNAHGGSEVKTMGDGFMASFSSATKALECAIAMQRAFSEHNETAEEPILVRVGLNAGEPIAEDDDLFGTAVNLAARICAQAEAGQILAPIVVRELAAGKQFMFADLGETELRGVEDPVRLYELRWREAG